MNTAQCDALYESSLDFITNFNFQVASDYKPHHPHRLQRKVLQLWIKVVLVMTRVIDFD